MLLIQNFTELVRESHDNSVAHGWWGDKNTDSPVTVDLTVPPPSTVMNIRDIASALCLIHSEISEALEDLRDGKIDTYFVDKATKTEYSLDELKSHAGITEDYLIPAEYKPCGFANELADIIIRVFDLAYAMGIDVEKEIVWKQKHNRTRPYKHGKKVI